MGRIALEIEKCLGFVDFEGNGGFGVNKTGLKGISM